MTYEELILEFEQKLNRNLFDGEKEFVSWLFEEIQKECYWFRKKEKFLF
ncbi:hypothetical protein RZN25_08395 [Bacillaceae bacterium S4-13-56]